MAPDIFKDCMVGLFMIDSQASRMIQLFGRDLTETKVSELMEYNETTRNVLETMLFRLVDEACPPVLQEQVAMRDEMIHKVLEDATVPYSDEEELIDNIFILSDLLWLSVTEDGEESKKAWEQIEDVFLRDYEEE